MAAKKIVLKLAIEDESSKKKALKRVAGVQGVDSVTVDMKENKITVIGDVDPVCLASKLRKFGFTDLLSVGPAKEEKKEEKKPQGEAKKENKAEPPKVEVVYVPLSYDYRPYEYTVVREEYSNTCVIC
ncbi:heavy metal-associated isoprenylated plant protein 39-like [Cryptomeria japonica]|uniref:heavy metal-associated isoprenylated plant protein 39-like n=1 Tax=Cryptomeria japonica TaxID=3369 RepID=UPI0027DA370B|nr:heavy metal-associated isoprenylated plant protein 39-like [Cryptomeria japonica]